MESTVIQYRIMDALSHVRHNLHRLDEVIPYYFDDLQKALFGKRLITRWAPVPILGMEYIRSGEKSVLAALVDRITSNPDAVYEGDRETGHPLSEIAMGYGSLYASTPRNEAQLAMVGAGGASSFDRKILEKSIYANVGNTPQTNLDAHVSRCRDVFTLLLDHGFDPYKKYRVHDRHDSGASFVSRWKRECDGDEFCRAMFALIEGAEAKKRGAYLDEVLPLADAPEDAPTPKRARL